MQLQVQHFLHVLPLGALVSGFMLVGVGCAVCVLFWVCAVWLSAHQQPVHAIYSLCNAAGPFLHQGHLTAPYCGMHGNLSGACMEVCWCLCVLAMLNAWSCTCCVDTDSVDPSTCIGQVLACMCCWLHALEYDRLPEAAVTVCMLSSCLAMPSALSCTHWDLSQHMHQSGAGTTVC